jgi:hypothetical protein
MNERKYQETPLSLKIDAAFRQAAKKVILRARQTDTPVFVWEEGRVKEILEDQFKMILIED